MPAILEDLQNILRGFKMSLGFNKLVSAFVGIMLSIIWVLVALTFASAFRLIAIGPMELISGFLISPNLGLCSLIRTLFSSIQSVDRAGYAVLVVLVLGLLMIWSVFAGSITRLAAVEFTKDEKIGIKDSLVFALKKFWSYFCSPLMPVMGVMFFIACNVIGGLLGQVKFAGEIAVAIGFPLAILSGFLIVFIGVIGIISFFLVYPTISAEGSDTFDAMSRAYSYVLSRPAHFLSLLISIIICGVVLAFFVSCGACLVMKTTYCTVGIGMGDKFDTIRAFIAGLGEGKVASLGSISMKFAALVFMLHIVLVKVIVGSIVVAFAGSASTIAYLILRKDVDGTEIDDVYIEEEEVTENVAEVERKEEKAETPVAKEEKTSDIKDPEPEKSEPEPEKARSQEPEPKKSEPQPEKTKKPEVRQKEAPKESDKPETPDESSDDNGKSPEKPA